MDSRWDRYDIIILISNSVWFREFRYNGLLKGTDGDYRPHFLKADNNNSLKNKNDTYGKGN